MKKRNKPKGLGVRPEKVSLPKTPKGGGVIEKRGSPRADALKKGLAANYGTERNPTLSVRGICLASTSYLPEVKERKKKKGGGERGKRCYM